MTTAVAYLRTSSRTNVDGDSAPRQQQAIDAYAKRHGIKVVREFNDAAVSGADPIDTRPGFQDLLEYMAGNGARVILIENASRFARDLAVQIAGHKLLQGLGYELIPVDAPDSFTNDTPTAAMVRQILGAVSQFEKAQLVAKLRGARDRKSKELGRRVEGNHGYRVSNPEVIREAKRLARKSPKTGKAKSLREIAAELAQLGHTTAKGQPFSASQVQRLIDAG
ncbi:MULTISPECIES: recombinase family protein [unclassified Mesorhizobium]|uniref:recombinase family protein n=1 Tax=unclassified Mesorhizobium TaxID=325217 RepID=UPI0011273071|nr:MULTISPECIES: recombinase family protein [unclassified Mesorhizobium]TPK59935.1 recombinase family protein [Mesorhizobium sp. B2-5-1]TPM66915.1 recombinase family protein [Mesorhizobium sp. B2-1-9]TPM88781.1 recombinase family protein [Mesorhizobium sp. B2-1-4]TPN08389.1 recombinase family protein [Mesorhizobium sp. B2-1-2]UCI14143.1 recombinase family protein [Mesorhizobium sp. B2-1-1]